MSESALRKHIKVDHFDHKPVSCEDCGKEFATEIRLKVHMRDMHREQNYLCDKCDMKFTTKSRLTRHLKDKHNYPSKEKFQCDKCEKSFGFASALKKHIEGVHRDDKQCICDICGKVFKNDVKMKSHRWRHTESNIGTFPCPVCKKVFTMRESMQSHNRRKHVGVEAKFQCRFCPKKYHDSTLKTEHEDSVHLNVKKYKCDLCGFASARRQGVVKHKLSQHSGITHECDQPDCRKVFKERGNLHAHKFKVHGILRPKMLESQNEQQ